MVSNLSYLSCLSERPLVGETIGQHFDAGCEAPPDNIAIISRHQTIALSYQRLQERVNHLTAGFHKIGLTSKDRLGIWAPNCWE